MKKPDDDKLFKLVKAMSDDEAAFFRKHYLNETTGKEPASAKLFEMLRMDQTYNEGDILRTLGIKPESLAVIKSNLYSGILESLRISAPPSRPERAIAIMIEQAEILIGKGLFKEAQQLLLKAEQQAKSDNAFYHMGIIKSWLVVLLQYFTDDTFHEKATRFFEEIIQNANDILVSQKIYGMYVVTTTLVMKGNFGRNNHDTELLEKIIDNELFRSDNLNYRHKTKVHLLATKAHYYFHKGELEKSYGYSLALWNEIKKHQKETGKEDATALLNVSMELMTAACNVKKFDEALACLAQFKKIAGRYFQGNAYYEGIHLYFLCQINDMKRGVKTGDPGFRGLMDFRNSEIFSRIPPQVSRGIDFLIADIFLSNGKFEESLVHSGKLALEKSTSMTRLDQLTSGRILHLMAMFETTYESKGKVFRCKNTLMHVRAKQFYETVRKLEDNYQYERLIFRFFMHLPEKTEAKELVRIFEKLNEDIDRLKSKPGNEYIRIMLLALDLQKWIGNKINEYHSIDLKF